MNAVCRSQKLWVGLLLFLAACVSARANVYATDIRLNGSLQAGVVVPGATVAISYVLNETATAGVSVRICSGSNVLKTFANAGASTGLNTVFWDGTNDNGSNVAVGVYNVRITAAAAGYDTWTNITDDGTNFEVFLPTGIAVNKNTNSPYYGRVFIGNGKAGLEPDNAYQDNGILKCNADGSAADEGGFGTGGYQWGNGGYQNPSPWKMDIGSDDRLYVDDWANNGVVASFDEVLSTNFLWVLRPDNYAYSFISLSGPCVRGPVTNMQIFMVDNNRLDFGLGIMSWTLNSDGVAATNDPGTVDVTLTNNSDLTLAPYAVSIDAAGNFYTIQRDETNDLNPRVLCFPPAPSNGPPDTTALWKTGSGDPTLINNYGVAVDPVGALVAVASRGYDDGFGSLLLLDGGVSIFLSSNGSLVTNITQDPEGRTNAEFFDVAWDNAGNVYTVYGVDELTSSGWRVYSPPGSNQATTIAVPFIQAYDALTPPGLSQPSAWMGQLSFMLSGQSNVTYIIQQSPDLTNWTAVATNFSPDSVRPVSVSPPDTQDFYRAVASP